MEYRGLWGRRLWGDSITTGRERERKRLRKRGPVWPCCRAELRGLRRSVPSTFSFTLTFPLPSV
jgi:hypothetical protein